MKLIIACFNKNLFYSSVKIDGENYIWLLYTVFLLKNKIKVKCFGWAFCRSASMPEHVPACIDIFTW
jgi:hypothetical protein